MIFYLVEKGDTRSAIANPLHFDVSRHQLIFEAILPMLSHPDKNYAGQVLRILPL